jgi:hypothetical protein
MSKYHVLGDYCFVMSGRTSRRWLAIFVALTVLSFSFLAVAHWHNGLQEDQQCLLCHVAHAPTLNWSHGANLPAPVATRAARVLPALDPQLELVSHQISSRAPPCASQLA